MKNTVFFLFSSFFFPVWMSAQTGALSQPDFFGKTNFETVEPSKNPFPEEGQRRPNGIGFNGGWGAPYGFGIQYSRMVIPKVDFNLGAGFSFSGLRAGLGVRYFFKEGSSPFLGLNYVTTTGISGLEITQNGTTGEYEIFSDKAVFFRGGYSIEVSDVQFIFNVGYGLPFNEKDAQFLNGDYSSSQQDLANLMALGGVEISMTLMLRFGKNG